MSSSLFSVFDIGVLPSLFRLPEGEGVGRLFKAAIAAPRFSGFPFSWRKYIAAEKFPGRH
jgi:hypothetical protein